MIQERSLTFWIDYFMQEFLPSITQEESDMVYGILSWEEDKKAAFILAKRLFEDKDEEVR